ncbi:hydrogen gas-evolving membrane-bound hydrogenase subunit E [Halalkalicoccus salilacus]|uniref:hydrogen gas-evolving membrane-bound hydrogenase subunit E n=1 Tax=Halalkalicoccus salilacus TaxID=3117459 RepID=UPI00300F73C4
MEPELTIVLAAVGLPFLVTLLTPLVFRYLGEHTGYVAAAVALISFILLATQVGNDGTVGMSWIPSLGVSIRFTIDGWALLFALLASGIGFLVFIYSVRYMRGDRNVSRYYATLLAFMGSILGIALAGDLVAFFVFWELTSLCSFILIGHHTEDAASRSAARMAMLVTVSGGLALLVGALMLAFASSQALGATTFNMTAMLANDEAMRAALNDSGLFVPVIVLFAVAAAAKSAQVPLHFWLPNAMVAPTPVSAFLHSATMVKVGVYFLGRVRPMLLGDEWTLVVATLGLVTMTVGALLAVVARSMKQLLAYSTASHLGLMVAGFGFTTATGGEAGVFHLLNHALFKAPLFLVAGIVAHEAGTYYLNELGGLWRDLPVTAAIAGVAGLSMAGIPPFNGFYSKELLFEATYEVAATAGGASWLYPTFALFASVFTVVYSLRFLAVFLGRRRAPIESIQRPPIALVAPPAVLSVGVVIVSVAPQLAVDVIVQAAVETTAVGSPKLHVGIPTYITPPVMMSVVTVVAGFSAFPYADRLGRLIQAMVRLPAPVRPSGWYERLLSTTEVTSARIGPLIHSGNLRTYVTFVLGSTSLLVLAGYLAVSPMDLAEAVGQSVPTAIALVLAIAVLGSLALTSTPSHVSGVLVLSIIGFMVAIFFVLTSAPDLALTQLVVEALVLILFLLVLEKLPSVYASIEPLVLARDVVVSVAVGVMVFASVLLSMRGPDDELTAAANYYVTESIPGGGGKNIVNVILVDFRALDTLGELVVITVAAVAVLVLVWMRDRGELQ